MISSDQWINLPVGYNLNDHVGVSRYDWILMTLLTLTDSFVVDGYPDFASKHCVLRLLWSL